MEMKAVSSIQDAQPYVAPKVVETYGDMSLLSDGRVLIDRYAVPNLEVKGVCAENGKTTYFIHLANRFGYHAEGIDQLHLMVSLTANAMAIAKGYSSFGANLRPMDEFNIMPLGIPGLEIKV